MSFADFPQINGGKISISTNYLYRFDLIIQYILYTYLCDAVYTYDLYEKNILLIGFFIHR